MESTVNTSERNQMIFRKINESATNIQTGRSQPRTVTTRTEGGGYRTVRQPSQPVAPSR